MKQSILSVIMLGLLGLSLALFFTLPGIAVAHAPIEKRIAALTRLIEQEPEDAEIYLLRGELYRVHKEWGLALADFKQAAKLNPGLAKVDLYIGRMFLESNQPEQAKVALKRFLTLKPDHPGARATLARTLVKLGLRVEAAREYTHAIELSLSPSPEFYIERAKALTDEDNEYVDEALHGLDEGLKKLGQPITLQLYAIDLEVKKNRFDAALKRLEHIIAKSPRKETWLVRRGEILEKAGRIDEAEKAFAAALTEIRKLPLHRQKTELMIRLETSALDALNRLAAVDKPGKEVER